MIDLIMQLDEEVARLRREVLVQLRSMSGEPLLVASVTLVGIRTIRELIEDGLIREVSPPDTRPVQGYRWLVLNSLLDRMAVVAAAED